LAINGGKESWAITVVMVPAGLLAKGGASKKTLTNSPTGRFPRRPPVRRKE
jgi:hypothetical protein